MISERRLAKSYGSFWRVAAPTMELFVRRCNLDWYEREFKPIASPLAPARRATINLLAFEIFHASAEKTSGAPADPSLPQRAWINVQPLFEGAEAYETALLAARLEPWMITGAERAEAVELARRMWLYFLQSGNRLFRTKPVFPGCGILMTCRGDVLIEPSTIVEMKDGDRPFRSYVFRQLALYAALLFNATGSLPEELRVLNSRTGVSVAMSTEDFSRQVAGQSASNFLYEIIRMLSEVTVSQ
jgi:hypothetical protein